MLELLTRGSHPLMLTKPKASSLVPEGRAQGGHFSFPHQRLHRSLTTLLVLYQYSLEWPDY